MRVAETTDPLAVIAEPVGLTKSKINIVGFAPSWEETPFDDSDAEFWGLNSLHKISGDRPWTRWFQLHDLRTHHGDDGEHLQWLQHTDVPIYMWLEHLLAYGIPGSVAYPKNQIVDYFGDYFTNSISWMLALAIACRPQQIGIYGVDMAQDGVLQSEYQHQRPSCEWLIGWAKGMGIDVYIPKTSDLMKATHLYGASDGDPFTQKLHARLKDMSNRKAQHDQQVTLHRDAALMLAGAIDNTTYFLRTWSTPTMAPLPHETALSGEPQGEPAHVPG